MSSLPVIGWSVNYRTFSKFNVTRAKLLKLMSKHNIPGTVAKAKIDRNAVIESVRETTKQLELAGKKKLRFTPEDGKDVMVMIIAAVGTDSSHDAQVDQLTKAIYNKETGTLTVEGQYVKEVMEGYERAKDSYNASQFRNIVLRYLKRECMAISYLETGNIYVVSKAKEDKLNNLAGLFEDLGADTCKLRKKEEYDTQAIRDVMWDVAIDELRDEIAHHRKDYEKQDALTEAGLASRLRKYKATEAKAHMWGSVLQEKVDNIARDIEGLTKAVHKKLAVD
jgi:hypothetical protein